MCRGWVGGCVCGGGGGGGRRRARPKLDGDVRCEQRNYTKTRGRAKRKAIQYMSTNIDFIYWIWGLLIKLPLHYFAISQLPFIVYYIFLQHKYNCNIIRIFLQVVNLSIFEDINSYTFAFFFHLPLPSFSCTIPCVARRIIVSLSEEERKPQNNFFFGWHHAGDKTVMNFGFIMRATNNLIVLGCHV